MFNVNFDKDATTHQISARTSMLSDLLSHIIGTDEMTLEVRGVRARDVPAWCSSVVFESDVPAWCSRVMIECEARELKVTRAAMLKCTLERLNILEYQY